MTQLRPGDVVLLFDGTVTPPKTKRWVCVAVAEGWFFRFNSNRHFRPHLPVAASDNPGCLDHDSYIELRGVLDYDMAAMADMLNRGEARVLGRIGLATAKLLAQAVSAAPTLRQIEIEAIVAALRSEYDRR